MTSHYLPICFFFFNDTATTEIYTLSLHDALPIYRAVLRADPARRHLGVHAGLGRADLGRALLLPVAAPHPERGARRRDLEDRKSTRLNSSHANISYAVFCLKKKKKKPYNRIYTTQ